MKGVEVVEVMDVVEAMERLGADGFGVGDGGGVEVTVPNCLRLLSLSQLNSARANWSPRVGTPGGDIVSFVINTGTVLVQKVAKKHRLSLQHLNDLI